MKITDKYVFFWKDTLAQWNAHEIYDPLFINRNNG